MVIETFEEESPEARLRYFLAINQLIEKPKIDPTIEEVRGLLPQKSMEEIERILGEAYLKKGSTMVPGPPIKVRRAFQLLRIKPNKREIVWEGTGRLSNSYKNMGTSKLNEWDGSCDQKEATIAEAYARKNWGNFLIEDAWNQVLGISGDIGDSKENIRAVIAVRYRTLQEALEDKEREESLDDVATHYVPRTFTIHRAVATEIRGNRSETPYFRLKI